MDKEMEEKVNGLRKAMKGLGTDEKSLINITLSYTKAERQELKKAYKTCLGRDLTDDLHSELSGDFRTIMEGLYDDEITYDAKCLYKAMKGLGTDEDTLIEIICTRSNSQLKKVKEQFEKLYKDTLEKWVVSETSGEFRKILVALLCCNRSENPVPNEEKCKELAHRLYVGGEGKLGTDEEIFNMVFCSNSPAEIECIEKWYSEITGKKKTLRGAVEGEFSFHSKQALLTILDYIHSPPEYFAKRINEAIKGLGTNEKKLSRVLVSREEVDIPQIREKYFALFNKDMVVAIEKDTSGDYKKVCSLLASKGK
jgi:hypothetical protein